MDKSREQFTNQDFLNLQTFRKNEQGVKTHVWFVQDGEILYVRTGEESGKVKRIRMNSLVQVAPCKMDGTLMGGWTSAHAVTISVA